MIIFLELEPESRFCILQWHLQGMIKGVGPPNDSAIQPIYKQ